MTQQPTSPTFTEKKPKSVESPSQSPTKPEPKDQQPTDFFEALKKTLDGKKIHRLDWKDRQYYGYLKNSRLMLHTPEGVNHTWTVNEGDMNGTDWITV